MNRRLLRRVIKIILILLLLSMVIDMEWLIETMVHCGFTMLVILGIVYLLSSLKKDKTKPD